MQYKLVNLLGRFLILFLRNQTIIKGSDFFKKLPIFLARFFKFSNSTKGNF